MEDLVVDVAYNNNSSVEASSPQIVGLEVLGEAGRASLVAGSAAIPFVLCSKDMPSAITDAR